ARFDSLMAGLGDRVPYVIALMALFSVVLVFAMTRSILLAVTNIVMNMLTIAATFGTLVLLFQWGWFGFHRIGTVEPTSMVIVGVLVSGLSTDYGVFLLSRIKEEHDGGAADLEAVAVGLDRTGPIVSSTTALLFVPLFAITLSRLAPLRELGLGAALAVLIDSTLVRGGLVPSVMALLGRWAWYAPLRRRGGVPGGDPDPAEGVPALRTRRTGDPRPAPQGPAPSGRRMPTRAAGLAAPGRPGAGYLVRCPPRLELRHRRPPGPPALAHPH